MKKIIILTVLSLGISSLSFAQSSKKMEKINLEVVESGEIKTMILTNRNVDVIPGESVIIHFNGRISKLDGQIIGTLANVKGNDKKLDTYKLDTALALIR